MKRALIVAGLIVGLIVVLIGLQVQRSLFGEGVSGESAIIGNSFVIAEFGYARGGRVLTYAVFRSFPTNSTAMEREHDSRFQETASGVFVRDNDGHMIPVGRDGTVYFFDGDHLRTMKVKAAETEIGISGSNTDELWADLQRFQVRTNH